MAVADDSFIHRYVPPTEPTARTTLLLLHGTGGDEASLLPLGRALLPGAGLLSPRGRVLEHGAPRFFRRLAEGVFDLPDLIARTDELAAWLPEAAARYGFDVASTIAVGYSNGANIAGSLLLLHPGLLGTAVLLRPMVPMVPDVAPDLVGTRVFAAAGRRDPIVPVAESERLVALLRGYRATVALHWSDGGHELANAEIAAARTWVAAGGREALD